MNNNDQSITINSVWYTLQEVEELAWKKLVNGSIKKKNGFRTMCVGTINENDESTLRTVVNRKVAQIDKTIYFYTDIRSRKIQNLQNDNRVSLLFYDAKQRVQITVKATATLHIDDDLQKQKWQTTSAQARLGYMTNEAPNTVSKKPTLGYDEKFSLVKPTAVESDLYKSNFVVVACKAYELEFLYLDYLGNRKANFYYKDTILINSFWAVP